ncbi:HAD-IA family hydrolase [Epidermidibacterium keratini]|uniref:HAD-IA family hydrolase n=1 Tax=Epidermidibacterium keratini TaxID=1891644 RepID=A0A7L4YIE3_9ACTN|nr:HAD-IA family hydrolase [Epidermidibacterium keratini]QHB98991.1 HAD-IA family hydrolase [Epidermidibacterium keratini]
MTEIDTMVFDLGQVLVRWDPRPALDGLHSADEIDAFLTGRFFTDNHGLDAGREFEELERELLEQAPQDAAIWRTYWDGFARSLGGPVPGMPELVGELKSAGLRLLGLTNWSAQTFHHAIPSAPVIGELEDILVSGREGLAKPDPAIFTLLIERFDLTPSTTVFTDDSPANIAAAEAAGLHAVHFTDAAELRVHLRALGLRLA